MIYYNIRGNQCKFKLGLYLCIITDNVDVKELGFFIWHTVKFLQGETLWKRYGANMGNQNGARKSYKVFHSCALLLTYRLKPKNRITRIKWRWKSGSGIYIYYAYYTMQCFNITECTYGKPICLEVW